MTEWRITFGVQYKREPHPAGWPHGDGWLSVFTDDPAMVRPIIEAVVGRTELGGLAFSNDYAPTDPHYPTLDRYPRGELARVVFTIN